MKIDFPSIKTYHHINGSTFLNNHSISRYLQKSKQMNLPFFYVEGISGRDAAITLHEDASRHIVQVLRMKATEKLRLTDGAGNIYTAEITKEHKKATEVKLLSSAFDAPPASQTTIAISLIKNTGRFEWFLEKATELGISIITPLLCERTEKQHFRVDRMKNILISAMLQSQQSRMPQFSEPVTFQKFITEERAGKKLIAHCIDSQKNELAEEVKGNTAVTILIGPEGDFTPAEIETALSKQYLPVSLGNTRLRTETAAVAAAVLMKLINK